MLYSTIFDGICCLLFLKEFGLTDATQTIPIPDDFFEWLSEQNISWMSEFVRQLLGNGFLKKKMIYCQKLELANPEHPENYLTNSLNDSRFWCHFCEKSYVNIDSLLIHEKAKHGYKESTKNTTAKDEKKMTCLII